MASIDTAPPDTPSSDTPPPSDTPPSTPQENILSTVNPHEQTDVSDSSNLDTNETRDTDIDNTSLFSTLISQLEHIFSKDYLSYDPYLVSQLDHEFYLPIALIEELPAIKALTADTALVHDALRASQKIVVSEERRMAKPACKLVERNTIILRDLPENVTEEEIRDLMKNEERFTSSILDLKLEYGNTCFIKFNSEDIILDAWNFLREQTLKGLPVKARIKSEYLLKSFSYRPPPPVAPYYATPPYSANGNTKGRMYPPGGRVTGGRGYNNNNTNNNKGGTWYPRGGYKANGYPPQVGDGRDGNYQRNSESQKGKGNRYGRRGKNFQGGRNFDEEGKSGRYNNRQKGGRGGGGFFPNGSNNKNDSGRRSPATLSMAPSQWPPLPSSEKDITFEEGYSKNRKDTQNLPPTPLNDSQPVQEEEWETTTENDETPTGSEILNSVPQSTKSPGDTPHSASPIDPGRSRTPTTNEVSSTETDQVNPVTVAPNVGKTQETPPGPPIPGWPEINSSSVKIPPKNTLQEKNRDDKLVMKTLPKQKKQQAIVNNDKEPTQNRPPTNTHPTGVGSGKSRKPGNYGKSKIKPQKSNSPPHQNPPPPPQKPAMVVPPPKPAGPSYADIARLNSPVHQQHVLPLSPPPSQQPQVPPAQVRPHHVQTQQQQQQERSD